MRVHGDSGKMGLRNSEDFKLPRGCCSQRIVSVICSSGGQAPWPDQPLLFGGGGGGGASMLEFLSEWGGLSSP